MKLGFAHRQSGDWQILAVTGEVDLATAGSLDEALKAMLADGTTKIAVDLEGVGFLDSTGLRVLVTAVRELGDTGRFAVIVTKPNLLKIFALTGLGEVMQICASDSELAS